MNNAVMDLSIFNLMIAYIFVLLLLVIFKTRGIHRERMILIATMRMSIQLTIMGYILMYVFKHPSWWLTLIMLSVMLSFAMYNAIKRVKIPLPKELKKIVVLSMSIGFICTVAIFMIAVLKVTPFYNPQYVIPISGMIIGNAMTGIALGANRLSSNMQDHREAIENSLMLGASIKAACHRDVNDAFDSAILPTMNNMLTMGIVSLPGMMTGQILSGTFPLTAIKYQIGIMLAILGCTSITVVIFVVLGYKTYFNASSALK
ncbi:MAG: iron export ABC transporter permease subunit FetB [Erysipelotrichaceae bacterium]